MSRFSHPRGSSSNSIPAHPVQVRLNHEVFPTYWPAAPDRNPLFLERRVYQGSSGRVYPLPVTDRIATEATPRRWRVVRLRNAFLEVMLLPELGGRIHGLRDRTNGYDLIYRQDIIKPALVGLAGPWLSGGIEFNWPQHHRPATFLPVDVAIERHPDGSVTVWCGDHDPMARMKGMHGVCLHPDRAVVELKVRVYNRTQSVQTFLWWANVATCVHEAYQSFFPPDVQFVADHARRSVSTYPLARNRYYGIDYASRPEHGVPAAERPTNFLPPSLGGAAAGLRYASNDLSFYANIPAPTSYMALGSEGEFVGGYDHRAQAGLIHLANRHISPGKKQWTWGNHAFGYAWDRNLTDADAQGEYRPYIELMAGVYTDNQPDFSFLGPGETRTWSQYWYPIQKIGPAQAANRLAALSLRVETASVRLGVCVSQPFPKATIELSSGQRRRRWRRNLTPGQPFTTEFQTSRSAPWPKLGTLARVLDQAGGEILRWEVRKLPPSPPPAPAVEPPAPRDVASSDELYLIGLHLEQYRHATRCPTDWWREALARDPGDARCHHALGRWHFHRGEFAIAERHLRSAIERLTQRNANPFDGEPFYSLGLCLRQLGRDADAYAAFYKATWNQAWQAPAFVALAEIDTRRQDWEAAREHLDRALRRDADHLRARHLLVLVLRRLGEARSANRLLGFTRALDPLDWCARWLTGERLSCDAQVRLDVAHDLARAGFLTEAIQWLDAPAAPQRDWPDQSWGAAPMVQYTLGWLHERAGAQAAARRCRQRAQDLPPDYCFPARLEDLAVLQSALAAHPLDARAAYYLGNLLYDRRRHTEAIACWERSARHAPRFPTVWRNLGIARFNVQRQPAQARRAYERAWRADPSDARVFYERDQLWKRLGVTPETRRRELLRHPELVDRRDDLTLELAALHTHVGEPAAALELLGRRTFQPWEGGEGAPLGQFVRAHLALGREALAKRQPESAQPHFSAALTAPPHLGEARHPLASPADVHFFLGHAWQAMGERDRAREHWQIAAATRGDFQEMSAREFSELTVYAALAERELGKTSRSRRLLEGLWRYAQQLATTSAVIDYFATSLPTLLLFDEDLTARQHQRAQFLQAQVQLARSETVSGRALLRRILRADPNHAGAIDLQRTGFPATFTRP